MADVVSLQMQVDSRPVDRATASLRRFASGANKTSRAVRNYRERVKQASKETRNLNTAANKVRSAFLLLSGGIAGVGIIEFANQVERATTQMNNINATMRVATGNAEAAGEQLQFIRMEAERLGLFFPSVSKQMAQFAAAARSSSITGGELRQIFSGIAEASRAMGLTAPQAEGAMMALQQMMSKGKVSAEELRQQLGERMPGSIQIMANALDVTTSKLFEMMENGELLSDEVLPKFGRELSRVFGGQAEIQADKIAAAIQRLRNSVFDLMAQGNLSGATQAINELSDVIASEKFQSSFDRFIQMISNLAGVIAKNLDIITALAASLSGLVLTRVIRFFANLTKSVGVLAASVKTAVPVMGAFAVALNRVKFSLLGLAGPAGALAGVAASFLIFQNNSKKARLGSASFTGSLEELDTELENIVDSANRASIAVLQSFQTEAEPGVQQFLEYSREIASVQNQISELEPIFARMKENMGLSDAEGLNLQIGREIARLREQLRQLVAAREEFTGDIDAWKRIQAAISQTEDKIARLEDGTVNTKEEMDDLADSVSSLMDELFPRQAALKDYLNNLDLVETALDKGLLTAKQAAAAQRELNKSYQEATSPEFSSDEDVNNTREISENLNAILGEYDPIVAAATEYANQMTAVQNAVDAGLISQQKAEKLIGKITDQFQEAQNSATGLEKVLKDVASAVQDDISNGLTDIIMQAESAKDVFADLLDMIARMLTQRLIADPIAEGITSFAGGLDFGSIFGGGSGGSSFQGVGNSVPMNANGGNVYGNQPSIVGERGPEMFVPRQDGQIVPNSQMGGGGGDVTVNIINQSGERLESQEQNRRRGPNGEQTIDVMVKSSMERLDSQGQLDGIFRRHGAKRQGQF